MGGSDLAGSNAPGITETDKPIDGWARLALTIREWGAGHLVLIRRLMLIRSGLTWAALVAVIVALAMKPVLREGFGVYLQLYWLLILWFWLCRSKTLSWRFVSGWFAASLAWSLVVAKVTYTLAIQATELRIGATTLGGDVRADGPSVAIAALGEESLKLLPLAAFALFAAQRVRRWTVLDFLLVGLTSGLAFQACEETLRRVWAQIAPPSLTTVLEGAGNRGPSSGYAQYGLWPTEGWSRTAGGGEFPGHHVTTGLVAAGIGIAVWLARTVARRRGPSTGLVLTLAIAVPALAWWVAVGVHAGSNATIAVESQNWTGNSTVPWFIRSGWRLGLHGERLGLILVAVWLLGLLLDTHRRRRAEAPDSAGPTADFRGLGRFAATDFVRVLRGHARQPGQSRLAALIRGRDEAAAVRRQWADSAAGGLPGASVTARALPRLAAAAVVTGLFWAALALGPRWAEQIGSSLLTSHSSWFAGLFDVVGAWWHHQSLATQLLLIAAAASLIVLSGGSFSLALFSTGILAYAAEHGAGAADLIRNPRAAIRSYLATTTPQAAALDLVEFGLTFFPAAATGAKAAEIARAEVTSVSRSVVTQEAEVTASRRVLETAEYRGAARETRVAEITGGRVVGAPGKPGLKVIKPNVGSTDVDVIGRNGEYIAVGGPAKAADVAKLGEKLRILKYAADKAGVRAQAYFEQGTPQSAIDKAVEILGADNVFLFGLTP